jgi:signal transduction histidine kinase
MQRPKWLLAILGLGLNRRAKDRQVRRGPKSTESEVALRKTGAGRIGVVYLDLRQQRLRLLNRVARWLRAEGVPFIAEDLAHCQLRTPDGQRVEAHQLPLIRAWRQEHSVESPFILVREGEPDLHLLWSASPQKEKGKVVGVFGSIYCGAGEPDWKLMAGLAHDLSTPLNALSLLASLLDRQTLSETDLRLCLGDMRAAIARALEVGTDLLDYCRGPAQKSPDVKASWFELQPFLENLLREQRASAREKGLTLTKNISDTQACEVYSDPVRLGRLFSNLLVNAIRYTHAGGVHVTAEWRLVRGSKALFLGVVDTGTGIPSEEQESIFQPFERGHATKEDDSGGSGMGLAVVESLKNDLGLELKVESEIGRGSAFFLILPEHVLRTVAGPDTGKLSPDDTAVPIPKPLPN